MEKKELSPEMRAEFAKQLNVPDSEKNLYTEFEFDIHPNDEERRPNKALICLGEYGMHFCRTGYYEQQMHNEQLGIDETHAGPLDHTGSIIRAGIHFMVVRLVKEPEGKYMVDIFFSPTGQFSIGPFERKDAFLFRNQVWSWRIAAPTGPQIIIGTVAHDKPGEVNGGAEGAAEEQRHG